MFLLSLHVLIVLINLSSSFFGTRLLPFVCLFVGLFCCLFLFCFVFCLPSLLVFYTLIAVLLAVCIMYATDSMFLFTPK